jgi:threonine/homoserine/homoserine lactone efflux protein
MTTFAITALLLIMMPGPDQALITRNVLWGGRAAGTRTLAGGALGVGVHATAAAVGLSALLLASAKAFVVLKVLGVAYLLWLGVQALTSARGRRHEPGEETVLGGAGGGPAYLRQGFLSNALNPKVALFFVTFLPQFLPTDAASPRSDALVLSGVFAALYVAWFGIYVAAVSRLADWLRRPAVQARVERITGVLLVAFATRLAMAGH